MSGGGAEEDERMSDSVRDPASGRRAARGGAFASAKMLEAQGYFQNVVKQELQTLLARGTKREVAVKMLLRRIVQCTDEPEVAAVRGVMRQFQMNHDDAVRALIVKQELGRLKRRGLDSFAAIAELTRKMQRESSEETTPMQQDEGGYSRTVQEDEGADADAENEEESSGDDSLDRKSAGPTEETEQAEKEQEDEVEQNQKLASGSKVGDGQDEEEDVRHDPAADVLSPEMNRDDGDEGHAEMQDLQDKKYVETSETEVAATAAATSAVATAEMAPPPSDKDVSNKDGHESSMSLIQRIGQVTISSSPSETTESNQSSANASPTDAESDDERTEGERESDAPSGSPSRISSPRATASSSYNASGQLGLTPQSRKRRAAAFGPQTSSGLGATGKSVQPLFPSLKKQKLCAQVGDGLLQMVSRKAKSTASSTKSATVATSDSSGGGSSTRGESTGGSSSGRSSKNLHKRQRASPTGMQDDDESPVAEELLLPHVHHHHSKRHKNSGH